MTSRQHSGAAARRREGALGARSAGEEATPGLQGPLGHGRAPGTERARARGAAEGGAAPTAALSGAPRAAVPGAAAGRRGPRCAKGAEASVCTGGWVPAGKFPWLLSCVLVVADGTSEIPDEYLNF